MSETAMREPKIVCKGCKAETEPGLFKKPENLKAILDALSEMGFTPDSDFIEFVKPKLAGLCVLCGETEVVKTALLSVVVDKIDEKETKECLVNILNSLTFLTQETVWLECKRAVHTEIVRSKRKLNARTAWRLFMVLCNIRGQPPHVEEAEANMMVALRKCGYSMGDLSFVFGRSKETVSRHINEGSLR